MPHEKGKQLFLARKSVSYLFIPLCSQLMAVTLCPFLYNGDDGLLHSSLLRKKDLAERKETQGNRPVLLERKMKVSEYEISILDFKSTSSLCIRFPSDGSTDSRSSYTEVEWINYCPDVFRILQDYGKVDFDDYMASICGQVTVKQLLAHGKSSTFLRLSHDDRFVMQTITKSEMKVFLDNLPGYYHHVRKYKNTLLTKFYGLHALKLAKSQKVYFVVMGNILHSDLHIHKHFNLKTTSQGRSSDNESTAEDALNIVFHLDRSTRNQLLIQLKHDCDFLEDMGIIDYTLLLGIHLSSPPTESLKRGSFTSAQPPSRGAYSPAESLGSSSPVQSPNNGSCSPVHLTGSEDGSEDGKSSVSSQNGDPQSSSQDCSLQSDQDHNSPPADDFQSPPRTVQPEEKLAVGLSACAVRKNLISRGKGKNNNVVLFFEVTNILHQYTISKRVENVFKSLQFDSLASSPGNPKGYSNRFQDFVGQIFPEETEL